MNGWFIEWKAENSWMYRWMVGLLDEWLGTHECGWMVGLLDERLVTHECEWMVGLLDEWLGTHECGWMVGLLDERLFIRWMAGNPWMCMNG